MLNKLYVGQQAKCSSLNTFSIVFDSFGMDMNSYSALLSNKITQLMLGGDSSIQTCAFRLQSKTTSLCSAWVMWAAIQWNQSPRAAHTSLFSAIFLNGCKFFDPDTKNATSGTAVNNDRRLVEYFQQRYRWVSYSEDTRRNSHTDNDPLTLCVPFSLAKVTCFNFDKFMHTNLENE